MKLSARIGSQDREVVVEALEGDKVGRWRVVVDGVERIVDARRDLIDPRSWSLILDGEVRVIDVDPGKEGDVLVEVRGAQVPVKLLDPRKALLDKVHVSRPREASGPLPVRAPMPGRVVKLLVKAGDGVTAGQGLVVVEAMKMENELRSPRAGTVDRIHVVEGQPVEPQEVLLTVS